MSYLTDLFREQAAVERQARTGEITLAQVPGQMLDEVIQRLPLSRRHLLRGSASASLLGVFGAASLVGCGGGGDKPESKNPLQQAADYSIRFAPIKRQVGEKVAVPANYTVQVLYCEGDALLPGATALDGKTATTLENYRKVAGGHHDGMHLFPLPGIDPNQGGLLVVNHENTWGEMFIKTVAASIGESNTLAAALRKRRDDGTLYYEKAVIALQARPWALAGVGVSVVEVGMVNGQWKVKADSKYNRRYTGLDTFNVSGPAASALGFKVVGTLNNCANGHTPWGTYLSCEETDGNYFDPSQPEQGYGWVVEVDPYGELLPSPVKRTALGRFAHENAAYLMAQDKRIAWYMGDDSTPGCIYKFVAKNPVNLADRKANLNLLDEGVLYAAQFNADGTGQWLELAVGKNGLVEGAKDPGKLCQLPPGVNPGPSTMDFKTQADVLIHAYEASRIAGATLMDRPEWVTVAPDGRIYCTLTNNGGRLRADAANPRAPNRNGHIVRWKEDGNRPESTTFTWEVFLTAGDPRLSSDSEKGNIQGDTFSMPDGLRVDPKGRLWVQTDMSLGENDTSYYVGTFGNNGLYSVDPDTRRSLRFLVGPNGCEITGIAYTPDLKNLFINIQHPTGQWPSNVQRNELPPRSATIVIRHKEGKPIGAA